MKPKEFDFAKGFSTDLLVCAGGFEDRAQTFVTRLNSEKTSIGDAIILRYESQRSDNEKGYGSLRVRLDELTSGRVVSVPVHADTPVNSLTEVRRKVAVRAEDGGARSITVDISGMTHLWALGTIDAGLMSGLDVQVIYTEAASYFPLKKDRTQLLEAWRGQQFDVAMKLLQSAALKSVHILPEFGGNFRPGRPVCLVLFVGYEPNRIVGLVDEYAPGAVVVVYGESPHSSLAWRTELSRQLHEDVFSSWKVREIETSTFDVERIRRTLESEFENVADQYDVAIAPQCSKMQALASYLFSREHPEVQLVFTSPVRFNPTRYSKGARRTFSWLLEASTI